VPPYAGYPLDPPFRSRFQARFIDPLSSSVTLSKQSSVAPPTNSEASIAPPSTLLQKLRDIILSTQYAAEARHALETISKFALPPFPQTALLKLAQIISTFPPPAELSPTMLARLMLTLHPALVYAPFQAWAVLSRQTEQAGLGELSGPFEQDPSGKESLGLLGYEVTSIQRKDDHSAVVSFQRKRKRNATSISVVVPAGPKPFRPFPLARETGFTPTPRFMGLLTCALQAHALGWDISVLPPALPSTASSSTSTLIKIFGQVLGYENEVIHLYKEIGGRELVMRRNIQDGGATTWEPR
jgi:hypothetical protein